MMYHTLSKIKVQFEQFQQQEQSLPPINYTDSFLKLNFV